MLRSILALSAVTLIALACGSDDGKNVARGEGAGAGGDAGTSTANGGGDSGVAAGQGGEPASSVSGAGGELGGGGATGEAGAPRGGTTSSGGAAGAAGAAGATSGSLYCEPGEYNSGEGGGFACEGEPRSVELSCAELFDAVLVSDGGPLWISFYPASSLREPLPGKVTVSYRSGDSVTEVNYPLHFDHVDGFWQVDIDDDSSLGTEEVHLRPFTVRTACGDTVHLMNDIVFVQAEPNTDSYELVCPDQG